MRAIPSIIIVILSLFLQFKIARADGGVTFNNIAIIVNSRDSNAELWQPFFNLLFEKWPSLLTNNKEIPIILISNEISYNNERVVNLLSPHGIGWTGNIREALLRLKQPYIIYLQEDYFLSKAVDEQRLYEILNGMEQGGAAYTQIYNARPSCEHREKLTPYQQIDGVFIKGSDERYRNSLQSAIWEREYLLLLLNETMDPWVFEEWSNDYSKQFARTYCVVLDNPPYEFKNILSKGRVDVSELVAINRQGYEFSFPSKKCNIPNSKEQPIMHLLTMNFPKFARSICNRLVDISY